MLPRNIGGPRCPQQDVVLYLNSSRNVTLQSPFETNYVTSIIHEFQEKPAMQHAVRVCVRVCVCVVYKKSSPLNTADFGLQPM